MDTTDTLVDGPTGPSFFALDCLFVFADSRGEEREPHCRFEGGMLIRFVLTGYDPGGFGTKQAFVGKMGMRD